MASLKKVNGKYHVRVRVKGHKTVCSNFQYKADAQKWSAETERSIRLGTFVDADKQDDKTLGELLQRYSEEISKNKKSCASERKRIRTLQKLDIASLKVSQINKNVFARFRDDRLKTVTPSTCLRDLSIFSHMIYAIYDARTDQVGHLGKPYGSESGFYLLVGPNWDGEKPKGIVKVIKSPTSLANLIPRLFMDDTKKDREAIQSVINQIMAYPLSEFTGKMKTKDWKKIPIFPAPDSGGAETKWVIPEKYFDQLPTVLTTVSPLPGEEALYGQFKALLEVANNNPDIKKIITEVAVDLDKSLIHDFLQWKYNGKPAGNGWNRSVNNAEWGLDYYNRAGTARSNMFDNRPNETQYFYTDNTSEGQKLVGNNNYKVTFKAGKLPPVNGFWSMTMYNEHHLFHANELNRFSLGTKNKTLKYGDDGSLTLYVGITNPGSDKESNWIPAPKGEFSVYIRSYWGKKGITEGTWIPPKVEKLM